MHKSLSLVAVLLAMLLAIGCSQNSGEIFQKAEAHRKLGEFDHAIREYHRVIKLDPSNGMAHLGLGLALISKGKKADAKKSFEDVLKLGNPPEAVAQAHRQLGDMAFDVNDHAAALEHYSKTTGVPPAKILVARIALIKSLLAKGQEEKGIEEILKLMSTSAGEAEFVALMDDPVTESARSKIRVQILNDADTKIKEGKFQEAQALLDQSGKYRSEDAETARKITAAQAVAASELGQCDKAREFWTKTVRAFPARSSESKFYANVCMMRSGAALDALKKFEAIPKDDQFYARTQPLIGEALKLIPVRHYKVSADSTPIYSGPNLKQKPIGKLPLGSDVAIIADEGKLWYRINNDGKGSAFLEQKAVTNKPLAIVVTKNGWDQIESGAGSWMLAFRPMVEFKMINLSSNSMNVVNVRMVVRQGRKVLSDDKFKVDISKNKPLKPGGIILAETPAGIKLELLTRPDKATVTLSVSLDGGPFEVYRELELNREVVEVTGD